MPKVGNKNKKTFLNDCMGDGTMNSEFPNNSQRYMVCLNLWQRSKKENKGEEIKWASIDKKGFFIY